MPTHTPTSTTIRPAHSAAGGAVPTTSPRHAALVAGAGYAALFGLAIFANFVVVTGLVVPDDARATLANLGESEQLLRLGTGAFLLVFLLDVAIAWALWVLLRDTHRDLALLSAWARLVYTVFLGVGVVYLLDAARLAGAGGPADSLDEGTRAVLVAAATGSFDDAWRVGLAAFGLHLVLLGLLLHRLGRRLGSRVEPVLGLLLAVAGSAYVLDTVASTLLTDYAAVADAFLVVVAVPSVLAEGALTVWLLARAGRRSADPVAQG